MRKHIVWATTVMAAVVLGLGLTAGADATVVTFQPGPEGKDATVWHNDGKTERANWNFGASLGMNVHATTWHGNRRRHAFIEFDLSGLSIASEDIASVKLSLRSWLDCDGSTTEYRDISLYKVTEDWIEGTGIWGEQPPDGITWNDQPSVDYLTPLATITELAGLTDDEVAAGGVWHVWDSNDPGNSGLVDLVKGWAAGTIDNYGLVIRLTDPDDTTHHPYHNYRTSDYMDDPSLRPILEISDTGGTPDPIPGDANLDNVVNDQDASLLAANWQYGPDATWGQGDFDGNGIVNDADASILAAHWQQSQEGTAPVPEPSSVVLLLCGMISLLFVARRRG